MRKTKKRTYRKPAEKKKLLKEIRMLRKEGLPLSRALHMSKVKTSTYYKWVSATRA